MLDSLYNQVPPTFIKLCLFFKGMHEKLFSQFSSNVCHVEKYFRPGFESVGEIKQVLHHVAITLLKLVIRAVCFIYVPVLISFRICIEVAVFCVIFLLCLNSGCYMLSVKTVNV